MQAQNDLYQKKLEDYLTLPEIARMRSFKQHRKSDTLSHVCRVALKSRNIAKRLHITVDEDTMLRGALLHDFYLYSTDEMEMSAYRHGISHAALALENASTLFDLNEKERNIIYSHMWPLNATHLPKCKEAWIISLADKICAVEELLNFRLAVA